MLLSYATVNFFYSLFYDGAADMPKVIFIYSMKGQLICQYTLLTKSHCGVSNTQVTVKALGPFVLILQIIPIVLIHVREYFIVYSKTDILLHFLPSLTNYIVCKQCIHVQL